MTTASASPQPQRGAPVAQNAPEKSPETQREEPDLALEPDLPSDGRDEVGEVMIRNLPQRPELSEQPSQPGPSNP